MSDGIDFLIGLVDNVSSPAAAVGKALDDVGKAFEGLGKMAEGLAEEDPEKVLEGMAQAAMAAAEAVLNLVEAGASLSVTMSDMRDDASAAFGAISGSAEAGGVMYDKARDLSIKLGLKQEDVISKLKRLMAAGMGGDQAAKALEAVADLDFATGQGDKLSNLLTKIQATGHLDSKSITALSKTVGLPQEQILEQLATVTHKSMAELKTAIKAGTIDAATGIDAIMGVVEKKFGGLAAGEGKDVFGSINAIKIAFMDLFSKVDTKPLSDFLQGILKSLQGPAGQALSASFSHLFGALFHLLDAFSGGKGPEGFVMGIAKAVDMMATIVETVGPVVVGVIRAIIGVIGFMIDHWKLIAVVTAPLWAPIVLGLALIGAAMLVLEAPVIAVVAAFVYLSDAIESVVSTVEGWISAAWDAVVGFFTGMYNAGANLIQGLVNGISDGASSVIQAAVSVAQGAINAVTSVLGIHSPSKVFAGLGHFAVEGMAQGIEANDNASDAMETMVAPPTAGAVAGAAHGAAQKAGGGKSTSNHMGGVVINITGGNAEETATAIRRQLVGIFDDIAVEGGASAA